VMWKTGILYVSLVAPPREKKHISFTKDLLYVVNFEMQMISVFTIVIDCCDGMDLNLESRSSRSNFSIN